jgi:predicted Zn-ribbon and HTH transcriptional regulator
MPLDQDVPAYAKSTARIFAVIGGIAAFVSSFLVIPLVVTVIWGSHTNMPFPMHTLTIAYIGLAIYGGYTFGFSTEKTNSQCPKCHSDWTFQSTNTIRNKQETTAFDAITKKKTRKVPSGWQEQTVDIKRTFKVTTYEDICQCSKCKDITYVPRSTKELLLEEVTARTPWQYKG